MITVLAHGPHGRGEPVVHMFVHKEAINVMEPLFLKFKEWNVSLVERVQTITTDKDSGFLNIIGKVFDNAFIQICRFHVSKYLKEQLRKVSMSTSVKSSIETTFSE